MEEGGIQAVLVVCTARILVYNCLDAPYQPAGGLPDRHVGYPKAPKSEETNFEETKFKGYKF